jgi:hypothetical protein
VNTLLSNADPEPDSPVYLDSAKSAEENAALVIKTTTSSVFLYRCS